jgi:hypothetical protein
VSADDPIHRGSGSPAGPGSSCFRRHHGILAYLDGTIGGMQVGARTHQRCDSPTAQLRSIRLIRDIRWQDQPAFRMKTFLHDALSIASPLGGTTVTSPDLECDDSSSLSPNEPSLGGTRSSFAQPACLGGTRPCTASLHYVYSVVHTSFS